jgi:polysaccharide biosynthesis protein VpsM
MPTHKLVYLAFLSAGLASQAAWAEGSGIVLAQVFDSSDQTVAPSTPADAAATSVPVLPSNSSSGLSTSQQANLAGYQAAGIGARDGSSRGGAVRMGPLFVYPELAFGFGRNDNITGTKTDKVASNFYTLQPGITAELKTRADTYSLQYQGNFTRYVSSKDDNVDQHYTAFNAENIFTGRSKINWLLAYTQGYDARGSNNTSTNLDEPSRWSMPQAKAMYSYGAQGAKGRIEVEAGTTHKSYLNNRDTMDVYDRNTNSYAGRFFYRIQPKTSLLFEARGAKNDYTASDATLDNKERRYYIGAEWEATAATSGSFKIGRMTKDFDQTGTKASGGSWEAAVRWEPLTYSYIDFLSSKSIDDPDGLGEYQVNKNYSAVWNHAWSSYVSSHVSIGKTNTKYEGDRTDDIYRYGVGMSYDMRRWLRLNVDYNYTTRDSTDADYEYNRNVLMFSVQGTL